MLPTLAGLAGAPLDAARPLDGVDVWPSLAAGQGSPRAGLFYNVEPTQRAVRDGDWKHVWTTLLQPTVELYDLAADPEETTDVAADHPERVAELQGRVIERARTMAPPLFHAAALRTTLSQPLTTPGGRCSG
jgi:arylsulfatase A-like enzyme